MRTLRMIHTNIINNVFSVATLLSTYVHMSIAFEFSVAVLVSCLLLSGPLSLGGVALRCVISGSNDGGPPVDAALFGIDLEAYWCFRPDNLSNHFLMTAARHNLPSP